MSTPFIESWLKTGHPTERVLDDAKSAPPTSLHPDSSYIQDEYPLPTDGMQKAFEPPGVDNVELDCDESWPSICSGSSSNDEEDIEDCQAAPLSLTRGLLQASAAALDSYNAILESRSLKTNEDITVYLSRCSMQSMEHLHSTAINAKDAAQLRRSAALLDIDYFLRRLDPLLAVYEKGNMTLSSVGDAIKCVQKAVQHLERSTRSPNQVSGQPAPPTINLLTPRSFKHSQRKIFSRIHEEIDHRPMAHFTARLFTTDGRFLTDHRLSQFLKV